MEERRVLSPETGGAVAVLVLLYDLIPIHLEGFFTFDSYFCAVASAFAGENSRG